MSKKQKKPAIQRSFRPQINPQNKMIKRDYTGADHGRLWNDWLTSSTSANAELYAILPTLRDRCRDLARNDVYAGGAIRLFCDNILGECGFNFQAKVKMLRGDGLSEPINRAIEDLIKHWSLRENCDVRGLHSFPQLERLIVRTWAESGEVLIRKVRKKFGNSKIPYALQVLEPDYLVEDHQVHLTNSESTVEMGVQTDKWGRVEGYWLYKGHPGDRINTGNNGSRYEVEFVPASEIDHIYICDRPGQLRGVPPLAIAIKRLHLMADTEEAELVAAKLAAFVGGIIKTKDTDNFSDSMRGEDHDQSEQDATGDEFRNFEPGMFMKLHPEEDAMPFTNNRPNQALPDFTKHIMRGFSAGVGLSYSGVTNDFSDASYSSHRAEKLKEIRSTRYYQNEFKEQFHSRQIREVISTAWLVGAINLPGFEVAEERYLAHQWLLPAFDWIDPQNDIAAALQAIGGGLSTYSIELGKRNLDFEEIIQQRKFEKEKLIEAGLLAPPEPGGDKPALKEGLAAVRSLLEGQSEEMRTILRQLESAPDVGAILMPLIQRAIDPTPVTVEVISSESSRDIARGAKNCKKGKPCGGSCQSKKNVCFVGLSAEQKSLALKARKAMKWGGGIASELLGDSGDDIRSKLHPTMQGWFDFVMSDASPSQEDVDFVKNIMGDMDYYQKKKVSKMISDNLTPEEAIAFEGYIGGQYKGMNEVLYNAEFFSESKQHNQNGLTFEEQMAVNRVAMSGMKKIKKATLEDIQVLDSTYDGSKPLLRHMDASPTLIDALKSNAERSLNSDEPFFHEQFLSTTFNQSGIGYFKEGANVEYRIKPKFDENHKGVLVDKYKNKAFEAEVLYPPMQKFRVTKIEEIQASEPVFETKKKPIYIEPKAKAQQTVAEIYEGQKFMDQMGLGGFNKTIIEKKIQQNMTPIKHLIDLMGDDNLEPYNGDWLTKKGMQDLYDAFGEEKQKVKGLKGGKKGLNSYGKQLANGLNKEKFIEVEVTVTISEGTNPGLIIEMEEL